MFSFTVGSAPIDINDITVDWGTSNSFDGWCFNATSTANLNNDITNGCGFFIEPTNDTLPANADVLVVTSEFFSLTDNDFSNLSDTLYILYQCGATAPGHFSNSSNNSLTVTTTNSCIGTETVSYVASSLVGGDGATVYFDAVGNASYVNNGCSAPITVVSTGWSFTPQLCNNNGIVDLNTLLDGNATTGGTWSGPRVTGSDYDPTGYTGLDSVTYSVVGSGTCTSAQDSTIVFTVSAPQIATANLQSCDSVYVSGTWYSSSTTLADTIFATGLECDSITNYTITIQNAITDSTYLASCDSVVFNGTTYTSSIILRDTIPGTTGTGSSCSQLFISEYIEGSSNNKALEIYNGTGVPVNLANYTIERYTNGSATASLPVLTLSGTLADGDVYVIYNATGTPNPTMVAAGDLASGYLNHNGDDAYALLENGVIIDVFGNIGCDPGAEWTDLGDGTQNNGFYRQANYTSGAVDPANTPCDFPSLNITNWVSADAIDDFSNLGTHTANCGTTVTPSCDSIFITNIEILTPVTTQNPANPILICDNNDSTQLADGTFVSAAGTYPILYAGGSASGCDSTYVTTVQTQNCNLTCSFDTILYDSFEYDSVIPGLVPGTVIHMSPRGTSSPFIGLSRTGTRFAYFNFQGTAGNVVYTREIDVCPGTDFRYSFWSRQFGNNPGSDVTINMYDGTSNAAPLLNSFNFTNNGTTYVQIISAIMTASTGTVFFELIDNIGGPIVGNDLLFEDFVVEGCVPDTLVLPAQNYCNNSNSDDLYNYASSSLGTNGTWSGPSALANGHLGTFDPTTSNFGTYYYTVPGLTSCSDTTASIVVSSLSGQIDTTVITACDSTLFNGTWYTSNSSRRDTLLAGASNGCDSIYQTDFVINQSVTVNNSGNPFIICSTNDSILLPGGTYAYTSGNYSFTYPGATSNGCDSTVLTEVLTEICDCNIDLGPDTAFCQGGSLVLDAGAGFDTYTWQDNSGNQTFTANATGTYHCTVTYLDSSNNLVTNGDFEQGNTGFTTDYGPGTGGSFGLLTNAGTYAINTSPSNVHNNFHSCTDHTSGTGNLMIVNGANTANTNVWCQNVTVQPNTDYLFSAWAISLENTDLANVSTLHFLIDGGQIGPNFSPSLTSCDWQQFSTTWNSGSSTNIQICIESDVISGNNDYGIDDIFFTPFCIATDSIDVTVNPLPTPNIGPDLTICLGTDTVLDATTANATYVWQDGTTTTPTFTAEDAGLYFVDVTVDGCTGRDSLNLTTTPVFNITENIAICDGDSAFLEGAWQTAAGVYTDNFTTTSNCDSVIVTTLSVVVTQTINETISVCADEVPVLVNGNLESVPGTYIDTLQSALGCDSIINVTVLEVNPLPIVALGTDTTIDAGTVVTISVINPDPTDTYTWINDLGDTFTGTSIQANAFETSEYILTATNLFNCTGNDSLTVFVNPLEQTLLQIPTAFSPNGDGVNEIFRIANYEDFDSYILRVYNRWGELIFDNEGYNVSWDGTYKEVAQNVGTYMYYIQATPANGGGNITRSGNVTLIK